MGSVKLGPSPQVVGGGHVDKSMREPEAVPSGLRGLDHMTTTPTTTRVFIPRTE